MPYLRTRLGTRWPEKEPLGVKVMKALLFFIPRGNPDYEAKLHLVHEWLVECGEAGDPWREIGLGADGHPVISGPDDRNYGFWCDTNMKWNDFQDREPISRDVFEDHWRRAASLRHGEVGAVDDPDDEDSDSRPART